MHDADTVYALGESIRELSRKMGTYEKCELSCCGVPISQYNAILEIGKAGDIALNDLAELIGLDNSTLSRTVNNLAENEWVTREVNPDDRRYIMIRLTESGRKVYEGLYTILESYYRHIYDSIPKEKRGQVAESVNLILEALRKNKCCE